MPPAVADTSNQIWWLLARWLLIYRRNVHAAVRRAPTGAAPDDARGGGVVREEGYGDEIEVTQ